MVPAHARLATLRTAITAALLLGLTAVGWSAGREPPADRPAPDEKKFSKVSLKIGGRDALGGQELAFQAGKTYPVVLRFRPAAGTKVTIVQFRLLTGLKDGRTGMMSAALERPKPGPGGTLVVKTPFRMTPDPGRFEFRVLSRDGDVIASTIVSVRQPGDLARARVAPDGSFTLSMREDGDGSIVGKN
jgi:hypothetical protein